MAKIELHGKNVSKTSYKYTGLACLGVFVVIVGTMCLSCKNVTTTKETVKAKAQERPNVLFVAIDDLNDWISPLGGNPQAITPNIAAFSKSAVNFTRNYCTSPGCAPSRASVMTGMHTYNSGMYSNYQDWRKVPRLTHSVTLGEYFRQQGYYAAGAGKIYHYGHVAPRTWDTYFPSQEQNMPKEYIPDSAPINMPPFKYMYKMFDWMELPFADEDTADFQSVDYISKQLKAARDKPFFLACGIYRPHVPWYVPKKYFDMFPLEAIKLPELMVNDTSDLGKRAKELIIRGGNYHKHVEAAGKWKEAIRGYLASMAFADAMFGRLLKGLEESGHADNTIVVLWSDHGWQLGEKKHWRKFALWENVIRSVLMVRAPKGIKALPEGSLPGKVVTAPTSLVDIYPTLIDLCGLPPKDGLDGISLRPYLTNDQRHEDRPVITTYDQGDYSVRYKHWHYIKYIDDTEELYDLEKDRHEWYNLAMEEKYAKNKMELESFLPVAPMPLPEVSLLPLMEHHIPPVRSKEYYESEERKAWMERFKN